MKLNSRKVMIVCSESCKELETRLVFDGWVVLRVDDAKTAIAKVRRERFDLVVLISTGKEMDVMETFFNLRDIRRSLPVIVVRQADETDKAIDGEYHLLPNAGLKSVQGMDGLISLLNDPNAQRSAGLDQVIRNP